MKRSFSSVHITYGLLVLLLLIAVAGSYVLSLTFTSTSSSLKSYMGLGTIVLFSSVFVLMLALWRFGPRSNDIGDYRWYLVVGILIRLFLIPTDAFTSNDLHRYLFDGHIANIGLDPYRISHDVAELSQAREVWNPPEEHTKYVTLYPPLALALFSVAASTGPELAELTWKVMLTIAGIVTMLLMLKILEHAGKLRHFALISFSPILIFESGVGAHVDGFSAMMVCLVLYFLQRSNLLMVGVALGLGTLVKLLPLVLLGPIVVALRSFPKSLSVTLGFLAALFFGYGVAYVLGMQPVGSIGVFFEKFRFGSPYFFALEGSGALSLDVIALISSVLLLFGFACVAAFVRRKNRPLLDSYNVNAMQATLAIPLLLTPVVYPWYLVPLMPLLALSPNVFVLIWMATLPLTYEVLGMFVCCGVWAPKAWPLIAIALGFVAAVIAMYINKKAH